MRGLYLITRPAAGGGTALVAVVEAALRGGAFMVQYRDKGTGAERRLREAMALREVCARYGAPLIVNDDVALAVEAKADGVHLGAGDEEVAVARNRLGAAALIGVSCYDELDRALEAVRNGADYVAFGSFFPSPTKPRAVRADKELLARASKRLDVPICAIGGITPENGGGLVRAGADMLAVLSAVFDAPDPGAAAADFARLFESREPVGEGRGS